MAFFQSALSKLTGTGYANVEEDDSSLDGASMVGQVEAVGEANAADVGIENVV